MHHAVKGQDEAALGVLLSGGAVAAIPPALQVVKAVVRVVQHRRLVRRLFPKHRTAHVMPAPLIPHKRIVTTLNLHAVQRPATLQAALSEPSSMAPQVTYSMHASTPSCYMTAGSALYFCIRCRREKSHLGALL